MGGVAHERTAGESGLGVVLGPSVTALGYELVGIEYVPARGGATLRVYIDSEAGISLDDCERVSHQLSGVLEVEDPIPGRYTLEVSSPGLDRPLFTREHYQRFAGHEIRLRTREPVNGRRNFTGTLVAVRDENVVMEEDGVELCVPLECVARANVVPEL